MIGETWKSIDQFAKHNALVQVIEKMMEIGAVQHRKNPCFPVLKRNVSDPIVTLDQKLTRRLRGDGNESWRMEVCFGRVQERDGQQQQKSDGQNDFDSLHLS